MLTQIFSSGSHSNIMLHATVYVMLCAAIYVIIITLI